MALFRMVVVAALFLLLGAWVSQATAHNNHVNKLGYPMPKQRPYSTDAETIDDEKYRIKNDVIRERPSSKSQEYMTTNNPYSRPPKKSSPKSSGGNSNNNGGNPTTQMPNPSFNNVSPNTVDAINNVVETTTEAMAEPPPPPPPESSGACDGNQRAFGGWLAVIIAVSLCYRHLL
ncbi:PREDICTED: uncharacterized protein LOC109169613 [Ipomoea nil]|uniref:uncharacterized protein LOC109169613 n=1 Tax=Ipomoea nil TaxID=35883 RepID=UPI000901D334|nr:PREDICTED: uncharacterized protein LOC109169613 [Ipomoea nil]